MKDKLITKLKESVILYKNYCHHLLLPLTMRNDEWLVKGCKLDNKLKELNFEIASLESQAKKPDTITTEFCQCPEPDIETGYSYCMRCHRQVSDQRMELLTREIEMTSETFNGRIDELGFWERALSASEVNLLKQEPEGVTAEEIFNKYCTLINRDYGDYVIKNKKAFLEAMEAYAKSKQIDLRGETTDDDIENASFDYMKKNNYMPSAGFHYGMGAKAALNGEIKHLTNH